MCPIALSKKEKKKNTFAMLFVKPGFWHNYTNRTYLERCQIRREFTTYSTSPTTGLFYSTSAPISLIRLHKQKRLCDIKTQLHHLVPKKLTNDRGGTLDVNKA